MKPTHQQLMEAVREAAAGRESFTFADVRQQLGVSTKDRRKLDQVYRGFRAFSAAAAEIEKVGPNCYRLRAPQQELSAQAIEPELIELDGAELCEVDEAAELAALAAPGGPEPVAAVPCESAAPEAASVAAAPEPTAAPAWRGHVLRFGHRIRHLFGARAVSRSGAAEAGAAAQA